MIVRMHTIQPDGEDTQMQVGARQAVGSAVPVVENTGAPQLVQASVLEPVLGRAVELGLGPGLRLSSIPVPVA